MKKTRILSFMASAVAVVALLTGCSTENDFENGKDGLASLELSSVSSSDMLTRAVIDGTNFPTDKGNIGLFLYADDEASKAYGDGYENVQYAYNDIKGKWTASPSIKVGSMPGYLYGYYPYNDNAANTDIKAIPVTSSVNGDDVMYASQQDPITDLTAANTSIKMNHALARVAIKVINNGYTGEAKLSSIKFEDATIASSGTLNAIDGSITASKADEVALSVLAAEQPIATGDGTTYECLLVPSEENDERQTVTLSLTIDGQVKSLTLSGNNGVIFKPGVKSTVTITLSNTGIALKSVSINDWDVVEVGEHKVTIQTADGIDPSDILTRAYVDENTVKILAFSQSDKCLECAVTGTAYVSRSISGSIFTFTISNIGSDVTATIDYEKTLAVTLSSNNSSWGSANYEGKPYKGERINLRANAYDGCRFIEWQDADGTTLSKDNPYSVTLTSDLTVKAVFEAPAGAFTVSDDDGRTKKLILFSPGNLYYDGSNGKWAFEANQYDFRTYAENSYNRGPSCINGNYYTDTKSGGTPENHWGLFGWVGMSSLFSADPELYGVSTRAEYENRPYYGRFAREALFHDWGTAIDSRTWRTLTINEWYYLFYGRTDARKKCGPAKVCGVPGYIILPDRFEDPKKNNDSYPFDYNSYAWDSNVYTSDGWEAMENNGAVFLPATEYYRDGYHLQKEPQITGYYWSSTSFYDYDDWNTYPWAYRIHLDKDGCLKEGWDRSNGCCVRLVKDVK